MALEKLFHLLAEKKTPPICIFAVGSPVTIKINGVCRPDQSRSG